MVTFRLRAEHGNFPLLIGWTLLLAFLHSAVTRAEGSAILFVFASIIPVSLISALVLLIPSLVSIAV